MLAVLGAVAANYLPATRSRADRAAVIGKNRDPQFDLELAARGAGRNCNTRGVALRHAQEAARRRRQIGLLRQIGDFGIIIVKDFGSVLLMHPETKAETLAYCVKSMMAAGSAISAAMGAEHCTGTARWASFRLHWGDRSPPSCCAAWAPTRSWHQ